MKKTIKIKESDLKNMIHKVLKEQSLPGHIKKGSKEHADWVRSHQRDG